jgi:acyl carrier protein
MPLTREGLLNYLDEKMGVDVSGVDDATPLFSSSLLDSFSMVDLIMFIEQQAGFRMDALDITLENLDSIGNILRLVENKLAV